MILHPTFIEGRFVRIYSAGEEIGFFGEINPQVLENFKVLRSCCCS